MKNHEFYLKKCLDLARKSFPKNTPNPMVGSVIVYKDEIIGKGYHEKYGSHHAEVNAINNVKDKSLLSQSTLYVNLEPCSHFGKTPPCSDLIIKYKLAKVVVGCVDTSSKVSGKGIQRMRNAGIEVVTGVLNEESRDLNKRFFTFHEKKRPYIILKWAESKDGFIAPLDQKEPLWMTSEESKKLVHKWRAEEDSILIGRITAEKDNPSLTVREVNGKNPTRIVIDKKGELADELEIFNGEAPTIVFTENPSAVYRNAQASIIDFKRLLNEINSFLYAKGILSLIVEGGAKTLSLYLDANIWDESRVLTGNATFETGLNAPRVPCEPVHIEDHFSDKISYYYNV